MQIEILLRDAQQKQAFTNNTDCLHDDCLQEGGGMPDRVKQCHEIGDIPHQEKQTETLDQVCPGLFIQIEGRSIAFRIE
jgi:hypothetical protein